tara:strand:+ start:24 stop:695 length:672 start_codon:yes stop_codon:yes gene_type:complete
MCQTSLTYTELAERYDFLVADRARLERQLHYCNLALTTAKPPAAPLAEPVKPARLRPMRRTPRGEGVFLSVTGPEGGAGAGGYVGKQVRVTLRGASTNGTKNVREAAQPAHVHPSMRLSRVLRALSEHDPSHMGVFASPESLKRVATTVAATPPTSKKPRACCVGRAERWCAVLPRYGDSSGVRERGDVLLLDTETQEKDARHTTALSELVLAEERLADACVA